MIVSNAGRRIPHVTIAPQPIAPDLYREMYNIMLLPTLPSPSYYLDGGENHFGVLREYVHGQTLVGRGLLRIDRVHGEREKAIENDAEHDEAHRQRVVLAIAAHQFLGRFVFCKSIIGAML